MRREGNARFGRRAQAVLVPLMPDWQTICKFFLEILEDTLHDDAY